MSEFTEYLQTVLTDSEDIHDIDELRTVLRDVIGAIVAKFDRIDGLLCMAEYRLACLDADAGGQDA